MERVRASQFICETLDVCMCLCLCMRVCVCVWVRVCVCELLGMTREKELDL